MGKKKKKKKHQSISILKEVDKTLNGTYDDIMEEIQDMQLQLFIADQKAQKKAKKKIKKDPNYFATSIERTEARKKVIKQIEGNSLLERLEKLFRDICPLIIVIGRLVASLILCILSFEPIKIHIKPETLEKWNSVYKTASSIK